MVAHGRLLCSTVMLSHFVVTTETPTVLHRVSQMDIKNRNEYLLKSGYRDHPLVSVRSVSGFVPSAVDTAFLDMLFGKKPKGLKTWPKAGNSLHWLSCRNGINLHTDPNYSRYAYQLVVRNDGWQMTDDQLTDTSLPQVGRRLLSPPFVTEESRRIFAKPAVIQRPSANGRDGNHVPTSRQPHNPKGNRRPDD